MHILNLIEINQQYEVWYCLLVDQQTIRLLVDLKYVELLDLKYGDAYS